MQMQIQQRKYNIKDPMSENKKGRKSNRCNTATSLMLILFGVSVVHMATDGECQCQAFTLSSPIMKNKKKYIDHNNNNNNALLLLHSAPPKSSVSNPTTYLFDDNEQQRSLAKKLNLKEGDDYSQSNRSLSMTFLPSIIGHRGSLYKEPENTIASFIQAYVDGAEAVELDVFYLPKCGNLVVFHGGGNDQNPGRLEDYCSVNGSILDYSLQEIRYGSSEGKKGPLSLNPSHLELACPTEKLFENGIIPTLEEVLVSLKKSVRVPNDFKVKIELKGENTAVPTFELVDRLNMLDGPSEGKISFSSFDHSRIATIRTLAEQNNKKNIETGALFSDDVPEDFVNVSKNVYGATEIHLKYDTCTKERIQEIHDAGLNSMCWMRGPVGMVEDVTLKYKDVGNEDLDMYNTIMRTGVRGMCVNRPDVLRFLLELRKENSFDMFQSGRDI